MRNPKLLHFHPAPGVPSSNWHLDHDHFTLLVPICVGDELLRYLHHLMRSHAKGLVPDLAKKRFLWRTKMARYRARKKAHPHD